MFPGRCDNDIYPVPLQAVFKYYCKGSVTWVTLEGVAVDLHLCEGVHQT